MTRASKEDGAVLLTTLLVMSLMAILAVSIMDDIRFAVKRAANIQAYAQADWYQKGAEDFTKSYLSKQISASSPEERNLVLNTPQPIILPIDGGMLALSVRDGSHCFSLGALGHAAGNRTFRQLLTTLGWSENEAARITTIAIDWQDADSQMLPGGAEDYTYLGQTPARRTSNTAFTSVTELRSLGLFSEEQYQTLRPFICSRGADQKLTVNINTLSKQQAPLLAAILGGPEALNVSVQLITQRPPSGYADLSALRPSPALASFDLKNAQLNQIGFEPAYIWVEAQINYLTATRVASFEFAIAGNRLERIYRGFGDEALRPLLEDPTL